MEVQRNACNANRRSKELRATPTGDPKNRVQRQPRSPENHRQYTGEDDVAAKGRAAQATNNQHTQEAKTHWWGTTQIR